MMLSPINQSVSFTSLATASLASLAGTCTMMSYVNMIEGPVFGATHNPASTSQALVSVGFEIFVLISMISLS